MRLITASGRPFPELRKMDDAELTKLFPLRIRSTMTGTKYCRSFHLFCQGTEKDGLYQAGTVEMVYIETPRRLRYEPVQRTSEQLAETHQGEREKINHGYGDKMFVDYTGKKLEVVDRSTGEIGEVEVFVAILPASHYVFVQATPTQQKQDFISSVNDALFFFGGVPKVVVPDNLKSAVDKASKYEPVLNRTFRDQGEHYGFAINPTRSYRPRDKALVEGAVTDRLPKDILSVVETDVLRADGAERRHFRKSSGH